MAATQYSPTDICACGNPLKVFASSGRVAYACSQACSRVLARRNKGQQPKRASSPPMCLGCGASVWPGTKRCKLCAAAFRLSSSPNRFTCEHCRVEFHRKLGGRHRKNKYKVRWCSVQCKTAWLAAHSPSPFSVVSFFVCAQCAAPFVERSKRHRLLCSDECTAERNKRAVQSKYTPIEPKRKECAECGRYFIGHGNALYCSKRCGRKAFRKVNGHDRGKHRKRARRAGVSYEPINAMRVFNRDGWRCQVCGKETPKARRGTNYSNAPELDHRVPIAQGGPHTYANTQCACRSCNSRKGATLVVGQMPLFVAPKKQAKSTNA